MDREIDFKFPFEPYDIQKDFMKTLYMALEDSKLGIFESPTGTGKSLSLCCGAIKWLKDHNEKEISNLENNIETLKNEIKLIDNKSDDWIHNQYNEYQKEIEITKLQAKLKNINLQTEKINKIRNNKTLKQKELNVNKYKLIQKKIDETKTNIDVKNDENINIDNVSSTEDDEFLLLENIENDKDSDEDCDNDACNKNENLATKIIFCSRTHSQLSQFVNEIKKTIYNDDISVVSLASRQQYCINPIVTKYKFQHLINEQCLDLQKGKKGKATSKGQDGKITKRSKTTSGCNFYNQFNIELLKDDILVDIQDIEDLVKNGKNSKTCPYYSARAAVQESQIIIIPYQTLLHKPTRCANGIDLKNNIVIIDEAHNLLETIGNIYSVEINGIQLQTALEKLKQYKHKYETKFSAKNLLYLNQIIYIIGKVIGMLKLTTVTCENINSDIYTLQDFVLKAEIDNYNFVPLLEFAINSKLAQKLNGFSIKYPKIVEEVKKKGNILKTRGLENFLKQISKNTPVEQNTDNIIDNKEENEKEKSISVVNALRCFLNFLEMLTSTYSDGRILTFRKNTVEESYHKFLLLNPAKQFIDIVQSSKSVIVAGGTMQPFSEFHDQLFFSAPPERIIEFSCGHVIPPENIFPICLSEGPSGKRLNFTYDMRKTSETLNEVGRILINVCQIVPGGIVCFFPSYEYEKLIYNYFLLNGIIEKIEIKKKIFREPKNTNQVDKILDDYTNAIKRFKGINSNLTGALMLSVVGGKLSEGLNFSDDLGRCVIVVGMPYPNIKSVELQEKMKYLNENISSSAGSIYYENLCIKAVNQCIGRAVRHAKDYATVILMDERYSKETIYKTLPKWIQDSLITDIKFGKAFGMIRNFFTSHKNN